MTLSFLSLECCLRVPILVFLPAQHIFFDMYVFAHRQWRWTIVIRKGVSIKVLTGVSHAFIFLLLGCGVSSLWGRSSNPLWYICRDGWSDDERRDHSATYSQCSGCVDMDRGIALTSAISFCSIYSTRGYTLFFLFKPHNKQNVFVCCVVRTMCDVFARWCQWTITGKTLNHDIQYLRFSASPYTLQPYPSIYTCLHFSMDSY